MKEYFALLIVALFAAGIMFYGPDSLFAVTEGGVAEEVLNEEYHDIEELDRQIEEEDANENPGEEGDVQVEDEKDYPDEKYVDDRG